MFLLGSNTLCRRAHLAVVLYFIANLPHFHLSCVLWRIGPEGKPSIMWPPSNGRLHTRRPRATRWLMSGLRRRPRAHATRCRGPSSARRAWHLCPGASINNTARWTSGQVRSERRYCPPRSKRTWGGPGSERKALTGRYYKFLSGHAVIESSEYF